MSGPDRPVPRRIGRPRWLDPRVIGGLILVIAAVVVGARVIGSSQQTTRVLAAVHDLAAGTVLTGADVTVVDVNLGDTAGHYVAGDASVAGRTVINPVRGGELVPASVIGEPLTGRLMVISVEPAHLPPGVTHGSVVDLILVSGDGATQKSQKIADQITVQSVAAPASGGLSGASSNNFQLAILLPADRAEVLVDLVPRGDVWVLLDPGPAK